MNATRRTVLGWLLAAVIAPPSIEPIKREGFSYRFSTKELDQSGAVESMTKLKMEIC